MPPLSIIFPLANATAALESMCINVYQKDHNIRSKVKDAG
jgi:hypothetical protein